jgi:hypothetical protein
VSADFVFGRDHQFQGVDATDIEWVGVAPGVAPKPEPRFELLEVPYSASRSAEQNPFHTEAA